MHSQQKISSVSLQSGKDLKKSNQSIKWRKQKNSGAPIFIAKSYQILQNSEYDQVIAWNEEGTNFIILDVQRFQEQILPIHFRHRNFSSFVRQLNMYDFHKIRNDNNKSIFQHKQFRRDHKQLLRNIKRKGSTGKKGEQNVSISGHQEIPDDIEETPRNQEKYFRTVETISRSCVESPITSLRVINASTYSNLQKSEKMQQFIKSLPQIILNQEQIHQKINELIKDPRYECLNTKKDIRKIITQIRRKLPRRDADQDLQELSIQEQIMADNIMEEEMPHEGMANPTLAVMTTQKYLPKSMNLIGSMNFCEDAEHLFYQKLY